MTSAPPAALEQALEQSHDVKAKVEACAEELALRNDAVQQEIADGLGDGALHLPDVVGDTRHQLAGRAAAEEGGGLIEDVAEQLVPHVADDPLPNVRHEVG